MQRVEAENVVGATDSRPVRLPVAWADDLGLEATGARFDKTGIPKALTYGEPDGCVKVVSEACFGEGLALHADAPHVGQVRSRNSTGTLIWNSSEETFHYPGYIVKKVKPNGERTWRRTVPSPDPITNVESEAIRRMVDAGVIVIASGGGGIPVVQDEHGRYKGVEAVIDKDLAGERLAEVVDADTFLILTDVEKAKLNYGTADEVELGEITLSDARKHLEDGHFLAGSMGPKIEACIRFLEWGGKRAIVTSMDKAVDALQGRTGTIIVSAKSGT